VMEMRTFMTSLLGRLSVWAGWSAEEVGGAQSWHERQDQERGAAGKSGQDEQDDYG
jgi:hypothetical protein